MQARTPVVTRVLLTGATGFVGSYVLRRLLDRGAEVAVIMRSTSRPWRIQDVLGRFRRVEADVSDIAPAREKVAEFRPDTLIHLAWSGTARGTRDRPEQVQNVAATLDLLRVVADAGARHFVGLGSQAEYGRCAGPVDEHARTMPVTLYGVAKLCAGILAEQLCRVVGVRFAWLRLFSAYGPMDDPGCMVPVLIEHLLACRRAPLTEGAQRWDYLYVEDAAEAICAVADQPGATGVFNLGSGHAPTIRTVAEELRQLANPECAIGFGDVPYEKDQVMHLQADIRRLTAATGWRPRTPLAEGLARTVAWHREQALAAGAGGMR